ncbi:phage tail family protein [Bacillus toyonensis]|uniref:phage tail family protein n=1 Tax=Bacillus toyonensis TaxID=155322 RepID=UPI000BEBAFB4|nr:phage tail family protein [Bacillus toyonensis]PED94044.1 phage tail protein [Bacillus toyonensis]PEK41651.1 phage tail protein [Bacillus toyonensis]PEL63126.1 phage tail protein [Bacillus toyonensis]PFZ39106.1 phage tail protein [Bacillus toyonensis]
MYLIIERMNGERYKLSKETGYILLKFRPESIKVNKLRERINGRPPINTGTEIEGRSIQVEILFEAYDFSDYALKRNEFFQILDSREDFYVIYSKEPGKRWLVSAEGFTPKPVSITLGMCEIVLYSTSPYAESIGTTLDLFTFDSELWQIGQGLIAEDVQYTHKISSFRIYNAGDEEIDPRKLPLAIRIRGATNGLTITNRTTGDTFKLNIPTAAGDTVELNRVRVFKNGNTVFASTNRKVIRLAPGWNDFIVSGISGAFQIEFDFRFYYL